MMVIGNLTESQLTNDVSERCPWIAEQNEYVFGFGMTLSLPSRDGLSSNYLQGRCHSLHAVAFNSLRISLAAV